MTYDEVEPHIRHWVEVTLVGETIPRFRGVLEWAGGAIAVFINGPPEDDPGDAGMPMPPRMSMSISKIAEITRLTDPPWLVERNKADTLAQAQTFLNQRNK